MAFSIEGETKKVMLNLLRKIDNGYTPTESEVQSLEKINVIDFSDLQLESLPASISRLSQLTSLRAANNALTTLPESIGKLSRLVSIDLSDNKLTSLPDSICNLAGLKSLIISDNWLVSLPSNIGNLSHLVALNLAGNQIADLPRNMENLSELSWLDISCNNLHTFPEVISRIKNLTNLNLSDNNLENLPQEIEHLKFLRRLLMQNNSLTSLPQALCTLTSLIELNVSNNRLYNFPEDMGGLYRLKQLCVANNSLEKLPDVIRNLTELEELDISSNPMKVLPNWVGYMPRLRKLSLAKLQLIQLPQTLLKLRIPFLADDSFYYVQNNLDYININGTQLSIQPISLFDQSRDHSASFRESRKLIENYFHTTQVPVREAKVIFLGDGFAGKTYTIQRLLNNCRKDQYPTTETHGILIEDLYAKKDGETYTIRIWDFGGQDIMHEMHRCFLTDRTCYVVMVDTRTNGQTGRARYWLRTIQTLAPKAPVFLLINEFSGGKNRDLDYTGLKRDFANIAGIEYCSSKDASDEDFRSKVESNIIKHALNLDSCKMKLPKSWENVHQDLLSFKENVGSEQKKMYYIDREAFHGLCDKYSIPSDSGLRAWLLTWFNDLGVCFSYHMGENGRERTKDYKILDPMWLTSAVYKIIWEKGPTPDGLIPLSEIYRILRIPGSEALKRDGIPCLEEVFYNEEECEYILEIMRMFRMSYPADGKTEFIPNLCNPNSNLDPTPLKWEHHIAYKFRYSFLPENVLHRLMIYCYTNLRPGMRWRKGFWLECVPCGLSAVIRVTEQNSIENELQIDVYAQTKEYEAWTWLQPLCQEIIEINKELSLKADSYILAENNQERKWFALDDVLYWTDCGDQFLTGKRTKFNISDILTLYYGNRFSKVKAKVDRNYSDINSSDTLDSHAHLLTYASAKLSPFDMKIPLQSQYPELIKQYKEIEERKIKAMQENTWALDNLLMALNSNTMSVSNNSAALIKNTVALRQIEIILGAIRDGEINLSQDVMESFFVELKKSTDSTLRDVMKELEQCAPKEKSSKFRDILGDAANITTIAAAIAQAGMALAPFLQCCFQQATFPMIL